MMMEHKRRLASFEPGSLICKAEKRHKTEVSTSKKEKKDMVGERIATLQHLVSPFGKTDTASILFEAVEYIKFLHEQVKVLSAPYLLSAPKETPESEQHSLQSCGLCLVPTSCTLRVTHTNGADIWASMKSSSPKY